MNLRLAFLGTGTCNSTARGPSSLAFSNDFEVVSVDFGGGAYHQIHRLNDSFFHHSKISTIFLTHFHIDHVSGLPDFFWGEIWDTSGSRNIPLSLIGPQGLKSFYNDRLLPFLGDCRFPFEVRLVELSDGEIYKGSFYTAQSYKLAHGEESTGYLFEINKINLAVTGDTEYCTNLIHLLNNADIAVMEWSISDNSSYAGHISTSDIIKLIKDEAIPEKLFITHIYPLPGVDFEEQIKKNKLLTDINSNRFFFPNDLEVIKLQ